jgi:hypothetical protein
VYAQKDTSIEKIGSWKTLNFQVQETLPNIYKKHYEIRRKYYPINNKNQLNIIWQDENEQKIVVSVFDKNLKNVSHITLKSSPNAQLFAATVDENGNYYYITHQTFSDKNDKVILYKADARGKILVEKELPTDKTKGLDIWKVGGNPGAMVCKNNQLLLAMARTLNKSNDGLNHQSGSAFLFDAKTLEIKRNFGQTSGHSFDNFLTLSSEGNFLEIDLGDNYPRGIHLHKFKDNNRNSRVVYTFKTLHATTADCYGIATYPKYPEISTPQKTFYKWSNDNATYTELGGLVEVKDGYLVIFAGEPDANGKSLDNRRAGENRDARNLGIIKVRKDFENATKKAPNVVTPDLILTKGIAEKGGFFDFGGDWNEQANEGVIWLTNYKDAENQNVRYIKTCLLPDGNTLILYALMPSSGNAEKSETFMLCVDSNAKITIPITSLGKDFKLNRRDEIILINKQVITIEGANNTLKLNVLDLK